MPMVRCVQCGCRLSPDDPVCATHGPQALPPDEGPALQKPPTPAVVGFTIQKLIGLGGFGAVYRAQQQSDGRTVALKLALGENPAARKSLAQEIWALRTVSKPFSPEFIGEGFAADGSPYLALEYVNAPTLGQLMEEMPGHWTVDRVAAVFGPLLEAMAVVHQAGIVHRDIKPDNFFVVASRSSVMVRVFDFGLSAPAGQMPEPDSAHEGTPEYLSPEQDTADMSMDPRADVYSLGVLLYELLAGCLPFAGSTSDMREGHRSRRPPVFARRVGIPQKVEAVVLQCLAKNRERRFANAGELLASLRDVWSAPVLNTAEYAAIVLPGANETGSFATTGTFASVTGAAPAAAPKAKAEQRPMGLLFFKPKEGQSVGPAEAKRLGGELASASPALGLVVAFDHESSDNPVRLAATAAQRAVELGLTDRALVDAFSVLMQVRPNGQRRYVSAGFNRKDRYLVDPFAPGVYLTQAASDLVPQLEGTSIPNTDLHQLVQAEQRELTSVGAVRHTFVGRDLELNQLFVSAAQSAVKNIPTIATITGEGGLGKSELAGALAAGLAQKIPQGEVFAFRCQEGMDGGQSRNIADLLRWGLGINKDLPHSEGRVLLAKAFGLAPEDPSWAPAALALGWIQLDHPDLKDLLSAPGALRAAIARAMGEALRLSSKRRPVIIVADDAHLADETLLDGLEYATLKDAESAVWVCMLTRPSLLVGRPLLGARAAANPVQELKPMLTDDAVRLARILLEPAENIPVAALQKLVNRTQGNPLLLVELVRSLKREGAIKQSSKGEYRLEVEAIDKLPDSPVVQWLATREIESLPPELAGHARMAAILGSDLSDEELEGVIVLAEEEGTAIETQLDAMVGLRRLVDANILVRHRSGRFSFRYGVLRDATYSSVPEVTRKGIHALAYRYYATYSKDSDEDRLPRLAFHSSRADMRELAAGFFIALGDNARKRHIYLDASNLYAQARSQIDPLARARLAPVLLAHAMMLFRVGQYDRALSGLTEARQNAQELGDTTSEFEILMEMATVSDFLNIFETSKLRTDEAELIIPERNDPLMRGRLLLSQGRSYYRSSKVEVSIPLLMEAAQLTASLGDAGYETQVDSLMMLGAAFASIGRFDEGLAVFDQLLEICARTHDRLHETGTISNRALIWLPLGNFAQIRVEYERGLKLARENCFSTVEVNLINNLAEVSLISGDLDAAAKYAEQSCSICDRLSGVGQYGALLSLMIQVRANLMKGRESEALRILTELERRLTVSAGTPSETVFSPSDSVLLDALRLATKEATDTEWTSVLQRSDEHSVQLEPMEIYSIRGLYAFRRGHNEVALAAFDRALTLAESSQTPLKPQIEAWRQSVVES